MVYGLLGSKVIGPCVVGLVCDDLKTSVGVQLESGLHGVDDLRVAVPCVQHRDSTGKVDVAPTLDIPYVKNFVGLAHARGNLPRPRRRSGHMPLPGPGLMSLTRTVPAGVPSVFQSSNPLAPSVAVN